jgi:multiple sugar transport system permease protein
MRNAPAPPPRDDDRVVEPPRGAMAVGTGGGEAGVAAALPAPAKAQGAEVAPVGDRTRNLRRRLAYVLLIGYALLMFVPFAWTVITSFKTLPDSTRLTIIPDPFTLAPWEYVFTKLDPNVVVLFTNSFAIALVVTISNLVLGSLAGYAFARLRFPGRGILFLIVLATLMIPDQLRMVPVYSLFRQVGLLQGFMQYVGVVLVLAISATSVFLLRQYFITIPKDLEEAARIDGAGFFTTFRKVMLPLATPALAAVTILQFQGTWNGLFWPAVLLSTDQDKWTLPLGLTMFRLTGGFGRDWPPLMAVVVLATIPILILYIFFQRYFVEGVAASGVKG